MTYAYVSYEPFANTKEQYAACMKEINDACDILLEGIEGNNKLTEAEKALLIHDRLIVWSEYDYEGYLYNTSPNEAYSLYGTLALQKGLCGAYTMAYMFLLDKVGIESDYCLSAEMEHAWNIVYIDGEAYHVDVTWDDPSWERAGHVKHNNFLRSTQGIIESGHYGSFDSTPTSIKYDSTDWVWRNSNASFVLLDDVIYYIDFISETIRSMDGSQSRVLCSVADSWSEEGGSTWSALACLAATDDMLLFSKEDGIYGYDFELKRVVPVYKPDLSAYDCTGVFGFKYEKDNLILDLDSGLWFNANQVKVRISVPYEKTSVPKGWVHTDSAWYFFVDGVPYTGWLFYGGYWYYMEEDGIMHVGWYYENGNWYYLDPNGRMVTGWTTINGDRYYFKSGGAMVWNCDYTIDGKRYRFDYDGVCRGEITAKRNGWVQEGSLWYYYQNDAMAIGWKQISGTWYFFDHYGGYMCTGWLYTGGHWYYFKSSGAMATGWLQLGDAWYYLSPSGAMVTGEYTIGSKVHKFNASGVWQGEVQNQKNGWVQENGGKWYYYQNGVKKTGWLQLGSTWYYMNADGAMVTGWLKLGSTWYYFQSSGAMVTGSLKIGTKTYKFASSDACLNP